MIQVGGKRGELRLFTLEWDDVQNTLTLVISTPCIFFPLYLSFFLWHALIIWTRANSTLSLLPHSLNSFFFTVFKSAVTPLWSLRPYIEIVLPMNHVLLVCAMIWVCGFQGFKMATIKQYRWNVKHTVMVVKYSTALLCIQLSWLYMSWYLNIIFKIDLCVIQNGSPSFVNL